MTGNRTLSKVAKEGPHYQMQFSVIHKTLPFRMEPYSSSKEYGRRMINPAEMPIAASRIKKQFLEVL